MPKYWKIKRELSRVLRTVSFYPFTLVQRFVMPAYYDFKLRDKIKMHEGALPRSRKVAIYLIFPSQGLLASHIASIRNIIECGYSPLVVSNLPLKPHDIQKLLSMTYRILERPNVGYDFGGYRDAILSIEADLVELDRLAVLNDSTWFPLKSEQRWLLDAESLGLDFVSANNSGPVDKVDPDMHSSIVWNYKRTGKLFHYCSFAWSIGPRILINRGFIDFWRHYLLRSDKNLTIKYGEVGFSRWVMRNGFTHSETCNLASLDQEISKLTDAELMHYVKRLILFGSPEFHKVRNQLLNSEKPPSRADLISFYLTATAKMSASYGAAAFTVERMGHPFLKKSPLWLDRSDSDALLAIAADIEGPMGDIIRAEADELVKKLPRTQ